MTGTEIEVGEENAAFQECSDSIHEDLQQRLEQCGNWVQNCNLEVVSFILAKKALPSEVEQKIFFPI